MIHLPCSYILNYSFTSNGSWERCLLSNPKAERIIKFIIPIDQIQRNRLIKKLIKFWNCYRDSVWTNIEKMVPY